VQPKGREVMEQTGRPFQVQLSGHTRFPWPDHPP